MARIAYVNGRYVDHAQASVHIEDRGYQFSDGIYEYIAFYNGIILDAELHWKRLERSLKELEIVKPMSMAALQLVVRELMDRNGRDDGGLYVQVSRGVSPRNHVFPKNVRPALVMTICGAKTPKAVEFSDGAKVITFPDNRWGRRDIKSVSLLANILAKQEAARKNVREAILYETDGKITEGSASNFFIVDKNGMAMTHPADTNILAGITRDVLFKLAAKAGVKMVEKEFSLDDSKVASEAFITSTSINVLPVVKIDDKMVGKGKVGEVTLKLQHAYNTYIFKQTGKKF